MSLLRRIDGPKKRDALLRGLLERLQQDETLIPLLEAVISAQNLELTDEQHQQVSTQPVDFFLPAPPPRPNPPPDLPRIEPNLVLKDLKPRLQNKLLAELDPVMDISRDKGRIIEAMRELLDTFLMEENLVMSKAEKERLYEAIIADIIGLGPLDTLLSDESITDIWVLGAKKVFVTRKGHRERSPIEFENDEHILRILDRIIAPIGKRCDESAPIASVRMPDGSYVQIVIRPIAQQGPSLYIQKYRWQRLTAEDLQRFGTLPPEVADMLRYALLASLNIVIVGKPLAGKTTLLNVLANMIPPEAFVTTIENALELMLPHEQLSMLQTRPPNIEGRGAVSTQQLSAQAVQFCPDYVILGGMHGDGLLPVIETATSFMLDITAPHSEAGMQQLKHRLRRAQPDMTDDLARDMLANAVHIVVEISPIRDGSRKITRITEPNPDGSSTPIFEFEYAEGEHPRSIGRLRPTGLRPRWIDSLLKVGWELPSFIPNVPVKKSGEDDPKME